MIKTKRDVLLQVYLVITLKKKLYTGLDYKFSFCIWIDTNRTHVHDFDKYIFVKLYDFLSELSIVWINFILKLIKYLDNHWANLPVAEKYAKQMKDSSLILRTKYKLQTKLA